MRTRVAASIRRRPLGLLGVVVLVAACASTPASASPSVAASPSSSPSASVSIAPASSAPAPTPTASPTVAPSPSPSTAEVCPIAPQTGKLPSDRLVDVQLSSTATSDLVTFVFGNMSVPEPPQGASEGTLQAAEPPYTQAASGLEMDITGDHVAQIRFSGMSLMNDAGEPTYDGRLDLTLDGAVALGDVRNFDMSEGIVGWYIGYFGNGCVTLRSDETSVTVVFDHPSS